MAETIQKGWLHTRDGEKFAPETLIENVTTRSGRPYDERVREYLSSVYSSLQSEINRIQNDGKDYSEEIKALKAIDAAFQTTLNTQGNAISELQAKDASLDQDINLLKAQDNVFETQLQYFNGDSSEALFIIDRNENVVAYIDSEGIHSIDFINKELVTFNSLVEAFRTIQGQLQYFNGDPDNAFYFIDNNENVITYINEEGVHSPAFISAPDDNSIYVVDNSDSNNPNVAVRINENGILALDFEAQGQPYTLIGLNTKIGTLEVAINNNTSNIGINASNISNLQGRMSRAEGRLTTVENKTNSLENRTTSLESRVNNVEDTTSTLEIWAEEVDSNLKDYYGYDDLKQEAVYFIDNEDNVITYISDQGVHAPAFIGPKDDAAIYIVDGSDQDNPNVLVRIDENNILALDFAAKDQPYTLVDLNQKISVHEQAIIRNESNITTNTGNITNLQGRTSSLEGRMETAEGDIDGLEGRATSLESRTTIVEEATASLNEWVEEADDILAEHGSDITNLQGRTLNIENRLSIAENDIDKVENRATALESRTEVVENITSSLNSWAEELDHNLKEYYGYEDIGQDAFYFIDKEKNVVALVDSAGLTTTNVTIKEGNNVKNIKDNVMFFETLGSINITIK